MRTPPSPLSDLRAAAPDAAVPDIVETALVRHRAFGDSLYIRDRLAVTYQRRLHKLRAALPQAGMLADLLDQAPAARQRQLTGDTVLRCAVQHAMRQLTLGDAYGLPLPQCGALFALAAEHLRQGRPGGPLVAHLPPESILAGGADGHGAQATYVWRQGGEAPATPYAAAFLAVMEENYGAPLSTPGASDMTMLWRGVELLDTLLPRLTRSALSHVQLLALFPKVGTWCGKASSSQFRVNGAIFLNQELIGNPWWLAEHLLHEALHQKLYDFRHGHSLLAAGYERDEASRVCSLWNAPDDSGSHYWDAHRTLAAFHVYVQLALLCLQAERQEEQLAPIYGPIGSHMSGSRRAIDRARYLGEQLREVSWPVLGTAGRQMSNWLLAVLDELDVERRPPGASLHLLLDLYARQSRKLDAFLARPGMPQADVLVRQARQEVMAARAALQALGEDDVEFTTVSGTQEAPDWPQARTQVLQALLPLAQDRSEKNLKKAGYAQAHDIVRQMVQQSSRQLAALGALGA